MRGDFFNAPPTISESHGPSETLLILPIELHQDIASDPPEDEQRIWYGENDVLKCFEAPGAELDAGDVMEMLPGISKRSAQKRLKTLFEKGEIGKAGGLIDYARSILVRQGIALEEMTINKILAEHLNDGLQSNVGSDGSEPMYIDGLIGINAKKIDHFFYIRAENDL